MQFSMDRHSRCANAAIHHDPDKSDVLREQAGSLAIRQLPSKFIFTYHPILIMTHESEIVHGLNANDVGPVSEKVSCRQKFNACLFL